MKTTFRWEQFIIIAICSLTLNVSAAYSPHSHRRHAVPPDTVLAQSTQGQNINPAVQCHPSCEELRSRAHKNGTVSVIVSLDASGLPSENDFPKKDRAAVREKIKSQVTKSQDDLIRRMAKYKITVRTRFTYMPGMLIVVDEKGFQALLTDPQVKHLSENTLLYPSLRESVPLIGADVATASGFNGDGFAIAVLDTGVAASHPFLAGKVVAEACFSGTEVGTTSLCPNGQTSQTGAGAAINCSLPGCEHGTHVAGIVAGQTSAFSGVAPKAKIVAIQIFSDSSAISSAHPLTASQADIIRALEYVRTLSQGTFWFAAANLSVGAGAYSTFCDDSFPDFKTAIDNLYPEQIATVVAAGNQSCKDSTGAVVGCSTQIGMPACISSAISVGATTKADTIPIYGNRSSFVSILAPGGNDDPDALSANCSEGYGPICSSVPGGGFKYMSGTSMAAPHVAGAMAILKSQSINADPQELLGLLQSSGVEVIDPVTNVKKRRIKLSGSLPWSVRYAPDGFDASQVTPAITTDLTGNLYVMGSDYSTDAAGNVLTQEFKFLKYSAQGQLQWAIPFSDGRRFYVPGTVTTDGAGHLLAAGSLCTETVGSCYHWRAMVFKFDSTGTLLWTAELPKTWDSSSVPQIAVDSTNNVYLGLSTCIDDCSTSADTYFTVAKYAPSGAQLWLTTYANPGNQDSAYAMTLDSANNVYLSGMLCGDGCLVTYAGTLKIDTDGNILWAQRYLGAANSEAYAVAVDNTGNVYVGGLATDVHAINNNFLTVSYTANGQERWARVEDDDTYDGVWALTVDNNGGVYATGEYWMIYKYDTNGVLQWSRQYTDSNWYGWASAISLDSGGNIYIAGQMQNNAQNYDQRYVTARYNASGTQIWSAEYNPNPMQGIYAPPALAVHANNPYLAGLSCTADYCNHSNWVAFKYTP